MRLTRRSYIGQFLGVGLALRCALAQPGRYRRTDSLLEENDFPFHTILKRIYRADVVIAVLGVPIFSRQGVGGGVAVLREAAQGDRRLVSLQFAGGANPERTHGIHYFGSTEEAVVESPAEPLRAASFGFVTARSSNQESFEQARQNLMAHSSHPAAAVTAVEQLIQQGKVRNLSATLPAGDVAWRDDWQELTKQVRSEFQQANATGQEVNCPADALTFLFAVLRATRTPGKSSFHYFHNAKPFRLECEKAADRHAAENFSAKRLTSSPQTVARLAGQIHDLTKGHTSTFKLWLDQSSDLPIRIEFSPRSYLRIALELDPTLEPSRKRKEEA